MPSAPVPAHQQFERQIARIHHLLEREGSEVIWNDHIPDPDVPSRLRQIDISIRRDGSLTLVECRLHGKPQDVKWIEELIGRRESLGADGVIAVSASGFTTTARKKALNRGVVLRDFAALTPDEIRTWGQERSMMLNYLSFSYVVYTINVAKKSNTHNFPRITAPDGKPVNPLNWYMPLRELMYRDDLVARDGKFTTVTGKVHNPLLVDGESPISIELVAKVQRISNPVPVFSVKGYVDPLNEVRLAEVGKFELGASEFIENRDRLAIYVDLSRLTIPDGCLFESVMTDAGREVPMHLSPIGMIPTVNCRIPIDIRIQVSENQNTQITGRLGILDVVGDEGPDGELSLNALLRV